MFCSECGKPAHGKFCSHCGSPLEPADAVTPPPPPVEVTPDWEHEVRYEAILQYPGVRSAIERSAQQAPKRLSGEQFLAIADKLMPVGVPMESLAAVAQSFWTRLGVKTARERTAQVRAPASQVLVRALCSLARHGQTLKKVNQAEDGCLLEAVLPSDVLSLAGEILVTVRRNSSGAEVAASAKIDGQFFDWGKSNRALDRLLDDLRREAA